MYKIDSPIPFDINLESYCKDCNMSDLSVDENGLFFNNERHIIRTIRCSKHDLCSTLYRHIKNKIEKGEEKIDEIQD